MWRPVSGVRRTPRWAASTWKTTACGTITVRWPAAAARHPKSMSLPKIGICSSKPPSSSSTERRTSMPAVLTASTAPDVVVLALVVLAALEAGLAAAGARDGDAELEQPAQRGPLAQLGAEDVGVGVGLGGGEQLLEGAGVGRGVVVEQPDPVGVAGLLEPEPDGGRVGRCCRARW